MDFQRKILYLHIRHPISSLVRVEWTKERRVCSKERFPYYFSFRLNDEDISDGEINRVLDSIKNIGDLLNIFRRYDENKSSNGNYDSLHKYSYVYLLLSITIITNYYSFVN